LRFKAVQNKLVDEPLTSGQLAPKISTETLPCALIFGDRVKR
jgi:hypothetical protein